MFPTDGKKYKEKQVKKSLKQNIDNFANVGNLLIENFIKQKNIDALKLIIYLAKLNTEFNNVIEIMEDENEIVTFEVPIDEICLFYKIEKSSFRGKIKKIRSTDFNYYDKIDEEEVFTTIFPEIRIKKDIVKIKMFKTLFKELKKNLQNIKEQGYTQIKFLDRLMKLKKFNAYRMFIFLNRIRDFKYQNKTFCLEEFNGYFEVNYKELKEIRKNILKPLEEDLKGTIPFSYEEVFDESTKIGRKPIVGYKIYYKESTQLENN